jgi:hypothetical protein
VIIGLHSSILLTQAPFQHLTAPSPQVVRVGHNSIEAAHVPSKHLYCVHLSVSTSLQSAEDLTHKPLLHKIGAELGQVTGVGHSSKDARHVLSQHWYGL